MAYNKQARLDNKLSRLGNAEREGAISSSDATAASLKLLAEGASASSAMDNGESLLHYWAEKGNLPCLEVAVKTVQRWELNSINNRSNETVVERAVEFSNWDCAKVLIEAGADVTRQNGHGETVLCKLVQKDKGVDCLRAALKVNPECINHSDYQGKTPLMNAAYEGATECLKVLLEGGAGVDIQSKSGQTALMAAVLGREPESLNLLLEAGANMALRDSAGDDAMAKCGVWKEGVERLLAEPAKRAAKRAAELDRKLDQACEAWSPPAASSNTIKTRQATTDTFSQSDQPQASRTRQRF